MSYRIAARASWARLSCLLALSCLAAGCRPPRGPGGSAFSRVDSPHFSVFSDLPVADIELQARRLEQLLAAFLEHGWDAHGELPLKVNVVMLSDRERLHEVTGEKIGGLMFSPLLFEPWIVVPTPDRKNDLQTLCHELTHSLAFQVMPYQPHWFSEGLASYFQTAVVEDGRFVLGKVPIPLLASVLHGQLLNHAQIFDDTADHWNARFYGSAWLLVHYLMSEHADAFVKYQVELARGQSHAQAWARAFPAHQGDRLDEQLRQYLRRAQFVNVSFPMGETSVLTRGKALHLADEESMWAILWTGKSGPRSAQAARHTELALRLDPDQVSALALAALAERDPATAQARVSRLTSSHPDSWLAWLTAALVHEKTAPSAAEPPSAVDRALSLVPRQPFALMLKAYELARQGDRVGALATSRRALRQQPSNVDLLWHRASLLSGLSECGPLMDVARTIRQVGHTRLSAQQQAELERILQRCFRQPPPN